jgi:Sulfotransferase family
MTFEASLMRPAKRAAVDDAPIFIVGAARSGTTLLRVILCGHSRLHIPPETWFIRDLVKRFSLTAELSSAERDEAVHMIVSNYRWPDLDMPAEELRRQVTELERPKPVDILNVLFHYQLAKTKKARFGDKTPNSIEIVPQLRVLYPGAKFIHLVRDGRDVAISHIDANWKTRCYDGRNFNWTKALRHRAAHSKAGFDARILDVRYEDLVTRLEPTVRRICDFIGEDFEPRMVESRDWMNLVPPRERGIHKRLGQPVSDEAVAAWRRRLSGFECFVMEACLYRQLFQWNYELRFAGAAWRPLLWGSGAALRVLSPLLHRGVAYLKRRNILSERCYL